MDRVQIDELRLLVGEAKKSASQSGVAKARLLSELAGLEKEVRALVAKLPDRKTTRSMQGQAGAVRVANNEADLAQIPGDEIELPGDEIEWICQTAIDAGDKLNTLSKQLEAVLTKLRVEIQHT